MSGENWTSGPWTAVAGEDNEAGMPINGIWGTVQGPNPAGYHVARVWCDADLPAEANARLIASAPDLYWALRALLEQCRHDGWPQVAEHSGLLIVARAALAKARGEQS